MNRKTNVKTNRNTFIPQQQVKKTVLQGKRFNEKNQMTEYLVSDNLAQDWIQMDKISAELIAKYEQKQQQHPMIDGKHLIRVVYLYTKDNMKFVKTQMEGEEYPVDYPYTYVKFHAPKALLDYMLTIYI